MKSRARSTSTSTPQTEYAWDSQDSRIDFKKIKYKPYCTSAICIEKTKNIHRSLTSNVGQKSVPKNQPLQDFFCNDCGSALVWLKETIE
jgi:hypothetical protein